LFSFIVRLLSFRKTNGECSILKYGTNNYTVMKRKKIFEIKEFFEKTIGFSVYKLLQGIIENIFF